MRVLHGTQFVKGHLIGGEVGLGRERKRWGREVMEREGTV